jgi:uncharacterized protein YjbI with pentapeptide repeats
MNKISCVFLSDDIFIIHIFDKYIIDNKLFDKQVVETVSLAINFNKNLLYENNTIISNNTPIKKYKGIVIYKNIEDFTCNYIIVDVFQKKKRKSSDFIIEKFNNVNLNNVNLNYVNIKDCNLLECALLENNFIDFLTSKLKDFVFDNTNRILYYNVLHDCDDKYTYDENNKLKLDFDILMHSFLEINTKNCIEHVEFDLYS